MRQDTSLVQEQIESIKDGMTIEANIAYQTLKKTKEWDLLINKFLLEKSVSRTVLLRADPSASAIRDGLDAQITMYGEFNQFLSALESNANRDSAKLEEAQTLLTKLQ